MPRYPISVRSQHLLPPAQHFQRT